MAITKDAKSVWKTDDAEYYGYVQSVYESREGQALGLLWFYRPADTTCVKMSYPYPNELFLSDHCNCGDPPVLAKEVIRKPQVVFFGGPETTGVEFFCRQQYIESESAWVSLTSLHFWCTCHHAVGTTTYTVGDTLLVADSSRISGPNLEPVVLVEHKPNGLDGMIKVLRLLRKGRDYGCNDAAPNELVLTDKSDILPLTYVHRPCYIRFYAEMDKKQGKIPTPYDRQGVSDFFFITSRELAGSLLEPIKEPPPYLKQGWDPTSEPIQPKLKGLDLFCGGGNFSRGLEEGGAVQVDWAVDWYNQAIHTYKANVSIDSHTKLFRGSVNYYLSQALEGKGNESVAQFDEVDFICAGSPCQGFSMANPNRGNESGFFNESMIASVVAFIDFYRPKYALMENVKGMAMGRTSPTHFFLLRSARNMVSGPALL